MVDNTKEKYTIASPEPVSLKQTEKIIETKTNNIFDECSSLTNIDLSNFNTNNVKYMNGMFFWCSSLKNINLSNFNTNIVKDMSRMFSKCSSLSNINLSNFNSNNATVMNNMFLGCEKLTKNKVITKDKRILIKFYIY